MASARRSHSRDSPDYYDILNVGRSASASEIKRAYLRLARQWHPDKNDPSKKAECERQFKAITEAYDTLRDGAKRAHYDRYGAEGGGGSAGSHPFSFAEADAMFRDFFATMGPSSGGKAGGSHGFGAGSDPFADAFSGMFGGMPRGHGGTRDPFPDVFRAMESMMSDMDRGMGGGSASSSFFSSSSGGVGGEDGVVARSTRSETMIRDGKRVTRTVRTVRYADGREETTTDESTGAASHAGLLDGGYRGADPSRRIER